MITKHMKRCSTWLVIRETQSKSTRRRYYAPPGMAAANSCDNTRVDQHVENLGLPCTAGCIILQFGLKTKHTPAIWRSNVTPRYVPKRNENVPAQGRVRKCSQQHYSRQPKARSNPSTDKWIHKMCYIHTMDCYSAIKRSKQLIQTTTWTNPKNMVVERSQTQKTT